MERKEELLQKFGKHLSELRKQKGLTVRELALAAHLQTAQVQRIEEGKVDFLLSTFVSLALGLEMSPEELLKGF